MHNTGKSIEERLRNERPAHSAPAGFTERVMAKLPNAHSNISEAPQRRPLWWPRFALGLAVVAIATVIAFEFLKEPQVEPVLVVNTAAGLDANRAPVLSSADSLDFTVPKITSEQLQALTTKLDQPLEKELENVISDTRLAIQFVASNFLPER